MKTLQKKLLLLLLMLPFGLLAQIEDSRAIEEIIIEEIRFHYINEKKEV